MAKGNNHKQANDSGLNLEGTIAKNVAEILAA